MCYSVLLLLLLTAAVAVFSSGQDQINSRVDLLMRMADEKWRLAQHAYDRLDVNIRRLDADLGRMEVRGCIIRSYVLVDAVRLACSTLLA